MRKVYVEVKVKLLININEGETIDNVIQEMDYNFTASSDTNADIIDTEIIEYDLVD